MVGGEEREIESEGEKDKFNYLQYSKFKCPRSDENVFVLEFFVTQF